LLIINIFAKIDSSKKINIYLLKLRYHIHATANTNLVDELKNIKE